jgi:hypothetical protein
MTVATIQFSEKVSASVTVATDDAHGSEQQQLMQMVAGMKLVL